MPFKRLLKFVGIISIILVLISGISIASSKKSADVFRGFLNNAASMINKSDFSKKYYELTYVGYNDELPEYTTTFGDDKYYIKTKTYDLLVDGALDEIFNEPKFYVMKNNNVYTTTYPYEDNYYNLRYLIADYLSPTIDFEKMINGSSLGQLEVYSILLETISNNLKDEYFYDSKSGSVNEYVLSMNKEQIKVFVKNLILDLNENDKFLDLVPGSKIEEDDLKSTFEEIDQFFDSMKEYNFKISLFTKGNKDGFVGFKASLSGMSGEDKFKLLFDLNSDCKNELKKEQKINAEFIFYAPGQNINCSLKADKNKIDLKFDENRETITVSYDYDYDNYYDSSKKYNVNVITTTPIPKISTKEIKSSGSIEIKANDKKELLKSSDIVANVYIKADDEEHSVVLNLKGDEKSFLKSKEIKLTYQLDNEKEVELIKLYSEDNKKLIDSSTIVLEIQDDGEVIKFRAKSNEPIIKSRELIFGLETEDKEIIELYRIKSNDKRDIYNSRDLDIIFSEKLARGKCILNIKSNDNKKIADSSNLEIKIDYETEDEFDNVILDIKIKGNKTLKDSSKYEITMYMYYEGETTKFEGTIESLDNKPLYQSKDFKGEIKLLDEHQDEMIKGTFNSKTGFEITANALDPNSKDRLYIKVNFLDKVDFYKLMDIKNAKEVSAEEFMFYVSPEADATLGRY